ncbi:glycosyltransferase [Fluviicola taffensis]|uniref:Glycosyl transferase group 1 n=1 Tax=Fluviicola taffensis (strain DSM 16823 / NCIMB 13979 / RW262) TaxID=755732 RepID=F2IFW2_FLUTR|nr:glycosyltransferase [Fluviicola taffensis]AEA43583.1 glycosyl transferase group 1 [Fluviicola taffensis DSM 16823]
MKKQTVIVSVINDLNTDQRVHKVCSFIQNQGYDVLLVGRALKSSQAMEFRTYRTKRFRMFFEKGVLFYAWFNFRLFWFLLFHRSSILVANDLDTLLPNYLVSKLKGINLVYDSHEYFTEVPELINRPKVKAIWERIERFFFPKLKFVSTVNHSIAEKYRQKYGVDLKVVRNVSPRWNPPKIQSKKELGIPEGKHILIMQGAGLNVDRGVEEAIRMMPFLENTVLLIVGDGDIIPEMKKLVEREKWTDLVLFFGKRSYLELLQFTQQADLGLSFDQPTNPNYLFSLPNKIFDYIQTSTPIICSDLVEVSKLVKSYEVGKIVSDFNPKELAKQIQTVLNNPELMESWKNNCKIAASKENWEVEVQQLNEFYPKIHE